MRLRAHKDLNVQVGDTHTTTVTGDAVTLVGGDAHTGVQGDRVEGVGRSRASLVSEVDALVVGGDRSTRVAGNALASVGGDTVSQVDGNAVRTTDRDALEHTAGDHTARIDGHSITHVGGRTLDGDAQAVTFVEGSWRLGATHTVEVRADAGGHHDDARLVLQCGNSSIVMSPESIEIRATVVRVVGREILELQGERSAMQLDDEGLRGQGRTVDLRTPGSEAVLHLSATEAILRHRNCTRLRGRDIHLETPSVGSVGSPTDTPLPTFPEPNVALQFTDEVIGRQGTALPVGSKWRVVAAGDDDFSAEGALEEQGVLRVYVPDAVEVIDVFIWPEGLEHAYPPEQGPLQWKVHLRDELGELGAPDSSATLEAARVRLRNLGYLPAADVAREEMDALTAEAVRRFRRDHRLAPGEDGAALDAEAIDKLREVYGA